MYKSEYCEAGEVGFEKLEGQESNSSDKIEFRYIYSLEEVAGGI